MHVFLPEILAESKTLSPGVLGVTIGLGAALWLFGWWGHRFWIVLFATSLAGITGMASGQAGDVHPIVLGLLVALAAGVLALALSRVMAFAAGGVVACLLVGWVAPALQQPVLTFLAGGLAGVLLFRGWTMVLTSFAGSLLIGYGGLSLADRLGKLDAVGLAESRAVMLTWACAGLTVAGTLGQFLLDRWWARRKKIKAEKAKVQELAEELHRNAKAAGKKSWGKPALKNAG